MMRNKLNIYIPIWLDLLYMEKKNLIGLCLNLHSNMVRFIMTGHGLSVASGH